VELIWSTLIAVAAYFLKNEVLDPLRAFRAVRWQAATILVIHENVLANTDMSTAQAKDAIRRLAAELRAAYMQIPLAGLWARLGLGLSPAEAGRAVPLLIGLSNSNDGEENRERIKDVRQALQII
jgi:two-component sensor histidine kinase